MAHPAGISERRACRYLGFKLSSIRYRSRRESQEPIRQRLRELATERMRWGYRRLHVLLVREGIRINRKRTYRLYREEGLAVRRRKRKRVAVTRIPLNRPSEPNECWAMDFMSDSLSTGRRYRILNVNDACCRMALACEAATSINAQGVIRTLEIISMEQGRYPARIRVDNGSEFRSQVLDTWAYERKIALEFIQPGKPSQNGDIESFNGKMRDELLNLHWWRTIQEAQEAIEKYRVDYNHVRPHSALGNRTPVEFLQTLAPVTPQRLVS